MPKAKKEPNKIVPSTIDIPKVEATLVSISGIEEMSLEDINKRKADLKAKREQVMLSVDSSKLEQARKVTTLMDNTLDRMSAIILSGEFDAKGYRDLAEAYDRLNRNLSMLYRLDTDCNGDFTEIHLTIKRG